MSDQHARVRSGFWRRLAMVLGAWTLIAIISTTHRFFGNNQNLPESVGWWQTFLTRLPNWYLWAALTPLIALGARLAPLATGHLRWSIPFHVAAAGLAVVIFEILFVPLRLLALHYFTPDAPLQTDPLNVAYVSATIHSAFEARFVADYFVYWAIVLAVSVYREALRVSRQERDIARVQSALVGARLEALSNRVHPHFLFNTLNAASALARTGRSTEVVAVIDDLADLLRAALSTQNRPQVPLHEEIDLVRKYLSIEQVRFGDRLAYEIDVEPDAQMCLLPPLIIQPLIENAIVHGVFPSPLPQTISIRIRCDDDRLTINVINTVDPAARNTTGLQLGLDTVRQRLGAMYLDEASLTLDQNNGRVTASMILPVCTEPVS